MTAKTTLKAGLRDGLNCGSEGERDEIVHGFDPDFEARSSATGR